MVGTLAAHGTSKCFRPSNLSRQQNGAVAEQVSLSMKYVSHGEVVLPSDNADPLSWLYDHRENVGPELCTAGIAAASRVPEASQGWVEGGVF
jgi:hypothetical protein